jgi:hypothetical protein
VIRVTKFDVVSARVPRLKGKADIPSAPNQRIVSMKKAAIFLVCLLWCQSAFAETKRYDASQFRPLLHPNYGLPERMPWGYDEAWVFSPPESYIIADLTPPSGCRLTATRANITIYGSWELMRVVAWVYPANNALPIHLGTYNTNGAPWAGSQTIAMNHNYVVQPGDRIYYWIRGTNSAHLAFWVERDTDCP